MKYEWEKIARFAKPCPFCGSHRVITENKENFDDAVNKSCTYIRCENCGVSIYGDPVVGGIDYNEAQRNVLKVWNRRVSA